MSDLDAKLAEIARTYDDIQAELSLPETSQDPAAIRRLGQEMSRLEPVVGAYRSLEATRTELTGARELRDSSEADDELKGMARDEIDRLEALEERLLADLRVLLLPRDPNDDRDVILEIRAGAGGDSGQVPLKAPLRADQFSRHAPTTDNQPQTPSLGIGG